MATRKQLAERVLRILQGGDVTKDSDIDIREIMLHIDSERDNLIQEKVIQSYKPASKRAVSSVVAHEILGTYITESTYLTGFDNNREKTFATLLQYPIDLPDGAGLLYVHDTEDFDISFSKMPAGMERIYAGLPSLSASNRSYYIQVGNRIYFDEESSPEQVTIGLVATSSSLLDDEVYPLSPGDESIIIRSIVDLYNIMAGVEQDNINDNIDK